LNDDKNHVGRTCPFCKLFRLYKNELTGQALSLQWIELFNMVFSIQFSTSSDLLENRTGLGVRVAKRIENTTSASFMMVCLKSIVVYGNADLEERNKFLIYKNPSSRLEKLIFFFYDAIRHGRKK